MRSRLFDKPRKFLLAMLLLAGCSSDRAEVVEKYIQIERLGRPGINEALVLSNDKLNAFNAIPPSADLTPAAEGVVAEATAVLTLIHKEATAAGLAPPSVANVAGGLLPDVMRIDTSLTVPVSGAGSVAYNRIENDNVQKPKIFTGGRKLTDDVMNITLGYLFNEEPTDTFGGAVQYDDNVSYYADAADCNSAGTGSNPAAPGHRCLEGQTSFYGPASFPFLAAAQ